MERRPLVYLGGDIGPLPSGDTIAVPRNFSYKKIVTAVSILVPENQQMLLKGDITIEGDLILDGELCLL